MRAGTKILVATAGSAAALLLCGAALAQPELGWEAVGTAVGTEAAGGIGPSPGGCIGDCSTIVHDAPGTNATGQTPLVYETVRINNIDYYHMILGTPPAQEGDEGFAQEVYIQAGGASGYQATFVNLNVPGGGGTSSGGANQNGDSCNSTGCGGNINASNPLATNQALSGAGTGNPNRVVMRQYLVDGDLTADFTKGELTTKPVITNRIDAPDIEINMVIDGSDNAYNTAASSPVTNTVVHRGDNLPPPASATFDMSTLDTQPGSNVNVTAGEYTTTNPAIGSPGGPYTYADPRESVNMSPDWASFFDHTEANPWAFPANRPTP